MFVLWQGSIGRHAQPDLRDVTLAALHDGDVQVIAKDSKLQVLSKIFLSGLPLCIISGGKLALESADTQARQWIQDALAVTCPFESDLDSRLGQRTSLTGLLVSVRSTEHSEQNLRSRQGPATTELVIFGVQSPVSETIDLYALPLSSELLVPLSSSELTPPASPANSEREGRFIDYPPRARDIANEKINLPPTRKRKSANEAFDEANERRHKAQRKGGEGVAAAAVASQNKHEHAVSNLAHRRSLSNSQAIPAVRRSLSRPPSISSSRPASARDASIPTTGRRSTLSRKQSMAEPIKSTDTTIESKNKETISKIVMAGMRMFGLTQIKSRKTSKSAPVVIEDEGETDVQNDQEYKLVYHQVYKAVVFTFRQQIDNFNLQSRADAVRETVDKLLTMFCNNPLMSQDGSAADLLTPGGRPAFGTATPLAREQADPFSQLTPSAQRGCLTVPG